MKKKYTKTINNWSDIPSLTYFEIPMPNEGLDKIAQKNSQILNQLNDPELRKKTLTKQKKLLTKIYKAASQTLTDKQYQVFVMKFIYGFSEKEISAQLGKCYSSLVIKACVKKIQKKLRLQEDFTYLKGNYE